jgi:hypothetical protein
VAPEILPAVKMAPDSPVPYYMAADYKLIHSVEDLQVIKTSGLSMKSIFSPQRRKERRGVIVEKTSLRSSRLRNQRPPAELGV